MKEFEGDLFNLGPDNQANEVFEKPKTNLDGIYRPKLSEAKDKKVGYRSVIRLLPNFIELGKLGQNAIEKNLHYAKFPNEENLTGYIQCAKDFSADKKCDLCKTFWRLAKSKNQLDVERAEQISLSTRYYSYVLILEDDQHPDLVGKILIYPYGYTIKEKILSEKKGEVSGKSIDVFDVAEGKDFVLLIKEGKGGYANYDASSFKEVSPIKIYDEKNKKFIVAPVDPTTGKITDNKVKKKILDFLLARTVDLKKYEAIPWDEATSAKVDDILSILNGNEIGAAHSRASRAGTDTSASRFSNGFDEEPETSQVATPPPRPSS